MSARLHVVRAGTGPHVVLVHGSATDHAAWAIQLASGLRDRFTLIAYDRRPDVTTVAEHADDLAGLAVPPVVVVGASFGAVIALELVRRDPSRIAGAVLIEPPMAASEERDARASELLADFDRCIEERGGPAAGELFLRAVMGDAVYERLPRTLREKSCNRWAAIRADSVALLAYRPRYAELARVTTPVLLLGGERSPPFFRQTLDALAAALPNARLEVVAGAGHGLHVDNPRRFAELVTAFADELQIR
jgi:pimeloyl-ACP methyl ester carboxylesterase